MFHHRRQRHRKRRGEFAHRQSGLLREPHHQRTPCGVRQCGEGAVERHGVKLYHMVKYRAVGERVNIFVFVRLDGTKLTRLEPRPTRLSPR